MNKKMKQQRKKLFIRVTMIMLASFVIVSVLLSLLALRITKEELFDNALAAFYELKNDVENAQWNYENIRSAAEGAASEYVSVPMTIPVTDVAPDNSSLVNWLFDLTTSSLTVRRTGNIQIVIKDVTDSYSWSGPPVVDTDDYLCDCFTAVENTESKSYDSGALSFKRFRKSLTDEQYEKIAFYLKDSPDDDSVKYLRAIRDGQDEFEDYYQLVCTEYYIGECELLIPKTVEIVKTNNSHDWYVQDEVIEHFDLSPSESDIKDREIKTASPDNKAVIRKDFFFHTFSSQNLKSRYLENTANGYDPSKLSPFHYIYSNSVSVIVDTEGYADPQDMSAETQKRLLVIEYYRDVNILLGARQRVLLLCGVSFLFFSVLGVILCALLWRVMKTQLEEEERRRQITNALAHDIKTPLFIIEGYAQNLKENLYTEKREHYADRLIERAEEVNRIVHRMLAFSKVDDRELLIRKEEFDFSLLVREVVAKLDDIPDWKKLRLNLSDECIICADRELMRSAVLNLIDNALRYSTPYAEVRITLSDRVFSVSNPCHDISQEDIGHLCEPYFRLEHNRRSDGSGLGLSIVKSILDLHGMILNISLEENIITFSFHW